MGDLFAIPNRKTARPHQEKALQMLRQSIGRGKRRVVLAAPTGAGKTYIASQIVAGARAKGKTVCFTVPLVTLINQTIAAFEAEGIYDIGVIQANHPRTDPTQPVQIASFQSMAKRGWPETDIVIVDECHVNYALMIDWMRSNHNRVWIGLSATPWARGMGDIWDELLIPVTIQELIDSGYLSPFRVYAPSHPDLSGVKVERGDYNEGQLAEVMGNSVLIADVVDTWLKRARGLPTIVFAVNLAHAEQIQQAFADKGVKFGYCHAKIDVAERQHMVNQMQRGEIAGIVNVGTLTTGFDSDVRCVVLARPTKSEILFVQMIGRGLRTAPGKDHCLILDHSDNHARLGFVTSINHDTLLTGKEKAPKPREKEKPEQVPRECPSCGAVKPRGVCPACGFEPKRQSEIEFEEGELVEITGKPKGPTMQDKQKFWSMALAVDHMRNKDGRLAKALYKSKFGVWPKGLHDHPMQPDGEFFSYERSRRIAYAKRRERA